MSHSEVSYSSALGSCECWAYAVTASPPSKIAPIPVLNRGWVRCAVGLHTALYSSRILLLLLRTPACGSSLISALIGRSVCTWLMQTLQQVLQTKQHDLVLCTGWLAQFLMVLRMLAMHMNSSYLNPELYIYIYVCRWTLQTLFIEFGVP